MFGELFCFLRIRLFTTLFILVMIQRVTNFPQKTDYMYQSNNYRRMNPQFQQRTQNFSFNENDSSQGRMTSDDTHRGDNRYNMIKFEETIASPLSIYFNSRYDFPGKEMSSTTQRPRFNWGVNNRQKVTNHKTIPAIKDTYDDISSRIIFPGQENVPVRTATNNLVPVCKEKTFCENVTNYPEDLLNNIIKKSGDLKIFTGSDVELDIAQRLDFDADYSLCNSNERIIYPKAAEAQNDKWYFIINIKNFTQGVRVETCSDEGGECNLIGSSFIEGYKTFCKQNYIVQKLAVVAHDGKSITEELFRFPTSCCCHSQFLGHTLDRMGFPLAKSNVTPVPKKTET